MAEVRPFGIDQTTGQQRQVADGDTLNAGNEIEIAVRRFGDYSSGFNQIYALHPWSTDPTRLADPASHPGEGGRGVSWSPGGEFLAVSHFLPGLGGDTIQIYQRTGNNFNNLLEPSSQPGVPSGQATRGLAFSNSGEFLAAAHSGSPNLTIYQRSGSTFTPITSISSFPASTGQSAAWSPNDEYLAVGEFSAPFLVLYRREGTTFTRLADPASAPVAQAGDSKGIAWSPQGDILTFAQSTKPLNYQLVDGSLELLSDPASIGTGGSGAAWSSDGKYLVVGDGSASNFSVFRRDGTTFTRLSDPQTGTSSVRNLIWSPNGKFLAIGRGASPGMVVYSFDKSTETITRVDEPSTTPPGSMFGMDWSSDQQFLVLAGAGTGSGAIRGFYQASQSMPSQGIVKGIGKILDT